jgi:serine protease Do
MKESKDIIRLFEDVIIQIATPYSTGTGFFMSEWNLIVTNEHVVRGNRAIVVAGRTFEKQMVDVIFLDARHDVAFLKAPQKHSMPDISMADGSELQEGDRVIAVGHPFDLKFTATQGIVSSLTQQENDIYYVQHDAALNPGNSGGPLIDTLGRVVGINTFIIQNGNSIGFSLPSRYIIACHATFSEGKGKPGVRCTSCQKVTFEPHTAASKTCENCGAELVLISQIPEYVPKGVSETVESVIQKLGFQIALTRKGPNAWVLKKRSATVYLSYYERNGMLLSDCVLCMLPEGDIAPMYRFLLEQNHELKGMWFSMQGQDVLFSVSLFDQYIEEEALYSLMDRFLECADKYDEILVNQFQAKRRQE